MRRPKSVDGQLQLPRLQKQEVNDVTWPQHVLQVQVYVGGRRLRE